jgi:hypothetical protein
MDTTRSSGCGSTRKGKNRCLNESSTSQEVFWRSPWKQKIQPRLHGCGLYWSTVHSSETPTVGTVFRRLLLHPGTYLVRRWNWKATALASILRSMIFLVSTLKAGWRAGLSAMLAEFIYRAITSGFWGAITQAFEEASPAWLGSLCALIVVPLVSHTLELIVHLLRGTPHLFAATASSVVFTVLSTVFNLYAMQHGALKSGAGASSFTSDLRRMPLLIERFVMAVPNAIWRATTRALNVAPQQFRGDGRQP